MSKTCLALLRCSLLALLWLVASSAAAGNCIPKIHILSSNASDRLIADVTVIGKADPGIPASADSAILLVSAIYAGAAPRRIVVDSGPPAVISIDCPFSIGSVPIGTRLFINVTQDPISGRLGAGRRDNFVYADGEEITGLLFAGDCASDDQNCLYSWQTMNVTAFTDMAESFYPGQFSAKPTIPLAGLDIGLRDGIPAQGAEIALEFETSFCSNAKPNAVRSGNEAGVLEISLQLIGRQVDISPAPPCDPGQPKTVPVGRVYETGSHVVKIYAENTDSLEGLFKAENLVGELPFEVREPNMLANSETPANGSTQSGISLIRGWACDAQSVHVQFDNLPTLELAYGSARADTLSVCGDQNNGYGAAFAWGSLGEGPHTMSTWIDGGHISTTEFEVRGLGEAFVTGLSADYELDNFPVTGHSVLVRWSQADQNFIIIDRLE